MIGNRRKGLRFFALSCILAAWFSTPTVLQAQDGAEQAGAARGEAAQLGEQLANPIANLISVPFELNWDTGLGETDADRWLLNVQPVIPFSLNDNWNVISRTIVPFIDLGAATVGGSSANGLGDIVQSFFFSPKEPTGNGWIWGAGPVFLLNTGKDEFTADQLGVGPTFVALKQKNGWTVGGLINHVVGFDEPDGRDAVSQTLLQPFVTYTTPEAWSYSINTESIYDRNTEEWTVPINLLLSKVVQFGDHPVSLRGGVRYYLDQPPGGPDWGLRFNVTLLFPK